MRVIVVDDEWLILSMISAEIKNLLPEAEVVSFGFGDEALEYAREHKADIAFLDINLAEYTGIEIAKELQRLYPKINIIFCTGYSDYALDAFGIYCSAYLMKPITKKKIQEALERLRYPVEDDSGIKVQCFGNFEVFFNGAPVKFKYTKTKEMFAYLIDRKGALISTEELMCALFVQDNKKSYTRNLKSDMIGTFQELGCEDIFLQEWGKIGIDITKVNCDYYAYLDGETELYHGEYMSQYSFSEERFANLLQNRVDDEKK